MGLSDKTLFMFGDNMIYEVHPFCAHPQCFFCFKPGVPHTLQGSIENIRHEHSSILSCMQVAYMLDFMPVVVLTSKVCPRSMESTVYALLAGFQNFGQQIARSIGQFMIGAFAIRTETPCNFDHLTSLLVVCHMLAPLLVIPFTFILIPDSRVTDEIVVDDVTRARESAPPYHFTDEGEEPGLTGDIDAENSVSLSAPRRRQQQQTVLGEQAKESSL